MMGLYALIFSLACASFMAGHEFKARRLVWAAVFAALSLNGALSIVGVAAQ
jgi:predicted membrane protein